MMNRYSRVGQAYNIYESITPTGSRFMPARNFDVVTLDILTVYAEDEGVYKCVARSAFGEAVASCTLRCKGKARAAECAFRIFHHSSPTPHSARPATGAVVVAHTAV